MAGVSACPTSVTAVTVKETSVKKKKPWPLIS